MRCRTPINSVLVRIWKGGRGLIQEYRVGEYSEYVEEARYLYKGGGVPYPCWFETVRYGTQCDGFFPGGWVGAFIV